MGIVIVVLVALAVLVVLGAADRGGLSDTRQICRGHNQSRGTRGRNREAIQPIGDSRGSLF